MHPDEFLKSAIQLSLNEFSHEWSYVRRMSSGGCAPLLAFIKHHFVRPTSLQYFDTRWQKWAPIRMNAFKRAAEVSAWHQIPKVGRRTAVKLMYPTKAMSLSMSSPHDYCVQALFPICGPAFAVVGGKNVVLYHPANSLSYYTLHNV